MRIDFSVVTPAPWPFMSRTWTAYTRRKPVISTFVYGLDIIDQLHRRVSKRKYQTPPPFLLWFSKPLAVERICIEIILIVRYKIYLQNVMSGTILLTITCYNEDFYLHYKIVVFHLTLLRSYCFLDSKLSLQYKRKKHVNISRLDIYKTNRAELIHIRIVCMMDMYWPKTFCTLQTWLNCFV